MIKPRIRPAEVLKDARRIADIERDRRIERIYELSREINLALLDSETSMFRLAEANNRIEGYISASTLIGTNGEKRDRIARLVVADKELLRDIGSPLLRSCLDWSQTNGRHVVTTAVRPLDRAMTTLYEDHGFTAAEQDAHAIGGPAMNFMIRSIE